MVRMLGEREEQRERETEDEALPDSAELEPEEWMRE
jgi:hypothetical protein